MKKIIVVILLMTCGTPQPLLKSGDPITDKVLIKVKGNHNRINYYRLQILDSIYKEGYIIKTDSI